MSRKILLIITGCLAISMALGTAAYALAPIRAVVLEVFGAPTAPTMTGSAGSISVVVAGTPTVTCSGASFTGTVNPGSYTAYATITTLSSGSCGSWIVSMPCSMTIDADTGQNVGTGPPDTNVTGTAHVTYGSGGCLRFQSTANGCTFDVGGNVATSFDETPDGNGDQGLSFSGSGLVVKNPYGCLGTPSNGSAVTLTATFRVHITATADEHVDFIP